MKRRELLVGASALATLTALPREVRAAPSGDYDFVIVGAGTAGLPAAIFASRRGARVLMLDAAPVIGGTLHLSTGQMSAAGTKLQKAKGIVDTPDAHYRDAMRINRNTADPALVRLAVNEAATTLDWLMDNGLEVLPDHPVYGSGHEFYTERRYQWAPQGGRSILAVLQQQLKPEVDSGRVTVQLSSPVTSLLIAKSGAVEGVRVKTPAGEREYRGRHVLLTVGGYASNSAMFEKLNGVPDYGDNSYPYSQGAGIDLGLQAGGYVRGKQNYLCSFGAVLAGEKIPSPVYARFQTWPQQRQPWEVYVNAAGARFIREDEPSVDRRDPERRAAGPERLGPRADEGCVQRAPDVQVGADDRGARRGDRRRSRGARAHDRRVQPRGRGEEGPAGARAHAGAGREAAVLRHPHAGLLHDLDRRARGRRPAARAAGEGRCRAEPVCGRRAAGRGPDDGQRVRRRHDGDARALLRALAGADAAGVRSGAIAAFDRRPLQRRFGRLRNAQGSTTGTSRSAKSRTLRVASVARRDVTIPAISVSRTPTGLPTLWRAAASIAVAAAASASKSATRPPSWSVSIPSSSRVSCARRRPAGSSSMP
jgi:hypothetical protein